MTESESFVERHILPVFTDLAVRACQKMKEDEKKGLSLLEQVSNYKSSQEIKATVLLLEIYPDLTPLISPPERKSL